MKLAVADWGIGGFSVFNRLTQLMPKTSMLYFSDAGRTPYGKMPEKELRARVLELILGFERDHGIRHVVIACNAASTVLPALQTQLARRGLHAVGVIEPGIELVRSSGCKHVGVIGGRRTILSRRFTLALNRGRGRQAIGRIAQPLSALIESGDLRSVRMTETLTSILRPLKNCDGLLLACTHYPAIADQIEQILPRCRLMDPAKSTAEFVRREWGRQLRSAGQTKYIYKTTGDGAAMRRSARAAFGNRLDRIIEI